MHSQGYDIGDSLMAMSEEMLLEWIMDFGGSYHMTPRTDFLFYFKEVNGGTVCSMTIEHVPLGAREEWKSKGDQGFFDGFVRNYEGKLCVLLGCTAESDEASVIFG
ncbi:hypothetical protein Tco_0612913 [Tanacetum coccineum]